MSAKRILIVEDDAISARVLRDLLEAKGYEIALARDGVEALEHFGSVSPDLMLVDVSLPRKNGFEVCFEVKRTAHGARMPVLLMSAVYRDPHGRAHAEEHLEAAGYLEKPFDLVELLGRVESLLGQAAA